MNKIRLTVFTLILATVSFAGCVEEEISPSAPAPTPTLTPTAAITPAAEEFTPEFGVKYLVVVVDVVDGDTIDVRLPDGNIERVRMLGVDTPETAAEKNKPGEYDDISDLSYLAMWGGGSKEVHRVGSRRKVMLYRVR